MIECNKKDFPTRTQNVKYKNYPPKTYKYGEPHKKILAQDKDLCVD